jgi:hypothetical protein
MFTAEIALIANRVQGIQSKLNFLHEFCNILGLYININETQVKVFKNGGAIAGAER